MTRVAITTDRFDRVAGVYRRFALEPVHLPCVRIDPAPPDVVGEAREQAGRVELLLVTSSRVVDLVWPHQAPPIPAIAVGPATAASIIDRGGQVVLTGAVGLAALLEDASDLLGDAAVLFPHAGGIDPDLLVSLRQMTGHLVDREVYRAVPVAPGLDVVAAVSFASPSAVEGWHLGRGLEGLITGVIGPTTRAALAGRSQPDVVATEPSHVALASGLARFMRASA